MPVERNICPSCRKGEMETTQQDTYLLTLKGPTEDVPAGFLAVEAHVCPLCRFVALYKTNQP